MQVYVESFYPLIILITLAASVLLNLGLAIAAFWNLFHRWRENNDLRILQERVRDLEVGFKAINSITMAGQTVLQDKRKSSSTGFHSFLKLKEQTEPKKQQEDRHVQVGTQDESRASVSTGLLPISIFQEEFVNAYNAAAEKRELRDDFWRRFSIIQIENMNAVQTRISDAPPDFKRSESGALFGVKEPDRDGFLVVPAFDEVVKHLPYESTYKFLFKFGVFDPSRVYQRFEVVSPAVLREDGNELKVHSLGEISLANQ